MLGEQESIGVSNPKSEYWKDKNWNDTNGLLWFVQVCWVYSKNIN